MDVLGLSPDGSHPVLTNLSNGGATVAYAVRADVFDCATGKKRNIYWKYRESKANVTWLSDNVVSINGITPDVTKDRYDFRREK